MAGRRVASALVTVRVAGADDATAVRAVHEAAFAGGAEAKLVEALVASQAHVPGYSLVAVHHDAVVGHVLGTRLPVGGRPAVALAPLAVVPAHQRLGVGTSLVEALLGAATLSGERLVVVGDPAYYGRFGFVPARTLGVVTPFGDGDAVQALVLPGDDLEVPVPTGDAVYPGPFADL